MIPVAEQRRIAEELLQASIDDAGYTTCPGAAYHTTGSGRRDFRLYLSDTDTPRENCFHQSCLAARTEFMRDFLRAIRAAERGSGATYTHRPSHTGEKPPLPAPTASIPPFNPEAAQRIADACPRDIDYCHLLDASPVFISPNPPDWPAQLIDNLYTPGERILIFTKFCSQGQYIRVAGKGNYTLASIPGHHATPGAQLPTSAPEGMWYLSAPVTGLWTPNPDKIDTDTGKPRLGRRHTACCTRFPFALLESDTIPVEQWLRILVQLNDPIAAVYTSGGKSIHALIAVDAATPEQFKAARRSLITRLAPLGADPAAITAVRLSRLPGCIRAEKPPPDNLQTLLYLNPCPRAGNPIINRL